VEIGRGYTEFAGFAVVNQKTTGYSVEPKTEAEDSTRRCGHPGRFNRPGGAVRPPGAGQIAWAGLTALGGRSDRPGCRRRDASKRRTRFGIARLASRLSRLRSSGIRPMKKFRRLPNPPLRGLYPYLLGEGSLVFWVPPYILLMGWMAANSWNPSSFVFPFSLLFFLSFS
jgi:hypothetical protein